MREFGVADGEMDGVWKRRKGDRIDRWMHREIDYCRVEWQRGETTDGHIRRQVFE